MCISYWKRNLNKSNLVSILSQYALYASKPALGCSPSKFLRSLWVNIILKHRSTYRFLVRSLKQFSSQASLAFGSDPPSSSFRTLRADPSDAATCNSVQPKASVVSLGLTEIVFCCFWSWPARQSSRSRTETPKVRAASARISTSGTLGRAGLFWTPVQLKSMGIWVSKPSSCRSHEEEGSSRVGTKFTCPEPLGPLGAAVFSNMSATVDCTSANKTGMKNGVIEIFVCKAEKPGRGLGGCSSSGWLNLCKQLGKQSEVSASTTPQVDFEPKPQGDDKNGKAVIWQGYKNIAKQCHTLQYLQSSWVKNFIDVKHPDSRIPFLG